MGLKILWIKTSPLHPLTRGGDLRSFHMLRCLNKDHHVVYSGMTSGPVQTEGAKQWPLYSAEAHWNDHREPTKTSWSFLFGAASNAVFSRLPYTLTRFQSKAWQAQIRKLIQEQKFDLVICDFLAPAPSLPWDVLQKPGSPALVLFQHNVESLIWQRRAEHASKWSGFYWHNQWQRMERYEQSISARFDGVVAVSAEDARLFRERFQLDNVLGDVPTGVDAAYFQAVPRQISDIPTIVFLGSMDWHANVDAVVQFAAHAWPKIREAIPDARFQIIGRAPLPPVQKLAEIPGIEVTGTVPDVRPLLRNAHAMVVPLRVGGGTRIKIYEAMAAEVPVISTSIGAEGLPLVADKEILFADTADETVHQVVRLLNNPSMAKTIASNALARITREYTWEAATKLFETHCLEALQRAKRRQ
ncbi:glycosyltransferase [Phragmitibacter flavus]|uniref:Glycosyltransferase n=1 Tax=Phragmitibacter flavus TaxID=2576071 RepID=A0A5R8KAA1_9BACT|nr:glycosyltransferase [Phragmitibacter flavus]TLD69252.1 glycosyltransferase [Phragmitibacter flavus]